MMISFLSVASINFIMLPSYMGIAPGENPQNAKSRWTHRKISSAKANVLPADKQQVRWRPLFDFLKSLEVPPISVTDYCDRLLEST
jgi:hypothetical protein